MSIMTNLSSLEKKSIEITLPEIEGTKYISKVPFSKLTTMSLEGDAQVILLKSELGAVQLIKYLNRNHINYKLLGAGSNLLLRENNDCLYLKLDFPFNQKSFYKRPLENTYDLPGNTPIASLTKYAMIHGLKGWEFFTGIPATLGGAIAMNAGTNLGEIASLIKEVTVLRSSGNLENILVENRQKDFFSYRGNSFLKKGDMILKAKLKHFGQSQDIPQKIREYLLLRKRTQPLSKKTLGCTFKNKDEACRVGLLLDILGLKGYRSNSFSIDHLHANFLIHDETCKGNSEELLDFISCIKKEFFLQFGIHLELEIKV